MSTRDWFGIHQAESENTPAFRPAAWDAHLPDVKDRAFQSFDANPQRYGGFLLLVQTPEWEFLTGVDDVEDRTIVGAILPRSMPGLPTAR
jgi:hypothetical protein